MIADLLPEKTRDRCWTCRRAQVTCLCAQVKSFSAQIQLVLLVHPRENRNAIGTARIAHLCVSNSILIEGNGFKFDQDPKIQHFTRSDPYHAVILYPGREAVNLSQISQAAARTHFPRDKKLVVFVIDGTWALAKKMIQRSEILRSLPQISFTPEHASSYRIRVEPAFHCVSTVEAVHQILGKLEGTRPEHANLLGVFDQMVEVQIDYEAKFGSPKTREKRNPCIA